MYCKKCEKQLDENVLICPICGTKLKFKRNLKIITILILSICLLTLGIYILVTNINSKKEREILNTQYVEITKIPYQNYITLSSFTFSLPTDLHYSNTEDYIYAASKDLTTSFKMNVVKADYSVLKEKYKTFVETILKNGTDVISYNFSTFGENEYFLIATKQNNQDYLYAITRLNEKYIVQTLIETKDDNGYEYAINNINNIIKKYEKLNTYLNNESGTFNDFLINDSSNNINLGDLFKVQVKG